MPRFHVNGHLRRCTRFSKNVLVVVFKRQVAKGEELWLSHLRVSKVEQMGDPGQR